MNFEFFFNNLPGLTITGLAFGAIYALIALGYTMVYGVLQLINFAHSEVFMYGTFAMLWTVMALGGADASGLELVLILLASLVASMVLSAGIALLLERVAYRPLIKKNAPRLIALISAIGAELRARRADGPARPDRRLVRPRRRPVRVRRQGAHQQQHRGCGRRAPLGRRRCRVSRASTCS